MSEVLLVLLQGPSFCGRHGSSEGGSTRFWHNEERYPRTLVYNYDEYGSPDVDVISVSIQRGKRGA